MVGKLKNGVTIKIRNSLCKLLTGKSWRVGSISPAGFLGCLPGKGGGGDSEVAWWERWESGKLGRWDVPGFIQSSWTQGESKILSLCF